MGDFGSNLSNLLRLRFVIRLDYSIMRGKVSGLGSVQVANSRVEIDENGLDTVGR
jgi:hypothetical protein